ncbi:MAG: alpha/beta hydrolase-fold protein [Spirochaetia bacterium]
MYKKEDRCRFDRFSAESLKGNPLGSPVERGIRIYLPPGYFESPVARYPVVYLLHGYGTDSSNSIVGSRKDIRKKYHILLRITFRKIFTRLPTFEDLDELILRGELPPFILVQPDGSLHLPNKFGAKGLNGKVGSKGSLYTDSPFTGKYTAYIFEDVVQCVDGHYRTICEKNGRALMGASMGGYGALLGGILYPSLFQAVVALSPSISCLDLLDVGLVAPFNRILFNNAKAEEMGRLELEDILDTCDLVYSDDRRLVPTLKRNEKGRVVEMDSSARNNWARSDLGPLAESHPEAFQGVRLLLNCEESDEFGFARPCRRFHALLQRQGIDHAFEIYSDPEAARISPHSLGIAWHILSGLRFCLRNPES